MMAKVTFTKSAKSFNYRLAKKSLGERNRLKDRVALEEVRPSRNDLLPRMVLENRPIALLRAPHRNVREQQPAHETEVAFSIKKLGFSSPPIVTEAGEIIDGVTKVAAAAALGMTELPCIVIYDLSQQDTKLLRIALNRLGEKGSSRFSLKVDKCATPLAPDERIVEMPLDQETVDGWHAAGYFPAGTSRRIEDIAEEELNFAYERWKQERNFQTREPGRRRRRSCS